MRRSMRLIAALLVVGAVGFGASAALGTTGSATAGSLSFSVTTADTATKGTLMSYSASIANSSQSAVNFQLKFTLTGPNGASGSQTYYVSLAGGKSLSKSGSHFIPYRAPSGTYTVTAQVTAGNASGQASASSNVS